MKKLLSIIFASATLFALTAIRVHAAEVTLVDTTAKGSTTSSANVYIDSDGESVKEVTILLTYDGSDTTIKSVSKGDISGCSYDYKTEEELTIICSYVTGQVYTNNDIVAKISYTTKSDSYAEKIFQVDNSNTILDGEKINNFGGTGNTTTTTTGSNNNGNNTTTTTTTTTTQTSTEPSSSKSGSKSFSDYLPYVLIAGAATLLVSLIGIFLISSKKKKVAEMAQAPDASADASLLNINPTDSTNTNQTPATDTLSTASTLPTMETLSAPEATQDNNSSIQTTNDANSAVDNINGILYNQENTPGQVFNSTNLGMEQQPTGQQDMNIAIDPNVSGAMNGTTPESQAVDLAALTGEATPITETPVIDNQLPNLDTLATPVAEPVVTETVPEVAPIAETPVVDNQMPNLDTLTTPVVEPAVTETVPEVAPIAETPVMDNQMPNLDTLATPVAEPVVTETVPE
ncbi:hypothetical protein J6Z48_03245, partial [bacterium]|nr:hypothetical protein [bacterium]